MLDGYKKQSLVNFIKNICISLVLGILTFVVMYFFYGFYKYGLKAPLVYGGSDEYQWYMLAKSINQNGWFWENDYLGAPYGQTLYDFSGFFHMNFENLMLKIWYVASNDVIMTINLQFLFNISFSVIVAYLVLNKMFDNRLKSAVGGVSVWNDSIHSRQRS